jgi:hypothetical protein
MPLELICPNPVCARAYRVKDESAGKKLKCRNCGTVIEVPGGPGGQTDTSTVAAAEESTSMPRHHPARLTCTNCGAVLGVRDATCSSCGGDVRSGVTIMRITEEDKEKAGLFRRRSRKKGRVPARASVPPKTVIVVVLLLAALIAGGIWVMKNRGSSPDGRAQEAPAATDTATP